MSTEVAAGRVQLVENAVRRHTNPTQVQLCDTEGLLLEDCLFSVFASTCISGLLIELSQGYDVTPEAQVQKGFGALYLSACYPCVITDGCACLSLAQSFDEVLPGDNQNITETVVRVGMRVKLRNRWDTTANKSNYTTPFIQVLCAPCFCIPCHNAAIIREVKPENAGSLWVCCNAPGQSNLGQRLL